MQLFNKTALFGALLVSTLIALPTASHATLIVSDSFTGTNGTSLNGRTPDTADLPGGTYTNRNYFSQPNAAIDTSIGVPLPSASTAANNLSYISIASTGGYTKPTALRISANLVLGPSSPVSFIDLGFVLGDPGTGNANSIGTNNGFNGLRFSNDGSVSLKTSTVSNGAAETVSVILPYNSTALGPLSSTAFYKLSFDVNFTTGDISDIVLSNGIGSSFVDVTTSAFTNAFTGFAAFGSGGPGGTLGHIDNFILQTIPVPEPSTLALAGLGAIGLGIRTRRRRNAA